MKESLKDLLLKCEVLLEEENYDELVKTLEKINRMDFRNLSKEDFQQALKIVDFLIDKAEKKRDEIAQKLMNFQRFKGSYLK